MEVRQVGLEINGLRGLRRLASHAFFRDLKRSGGSPGMAKSFCGRIILQWFLPGDPAEATQ
jgi:hypothetical protein